MRSITNIYSLTRIHNMSLSVVVPSETAQACCLTHNGLKSSSLKGQSNEIFDPQFFSSFEPVWGDSGPLTNGLKYFRFWLCFRRIFPEFLAVSYCVESSSAQYHTARSQRPLLLHRPLKGQCNKNKYIFR